MPYVGSDAPIEIQVPDKYMNLDYPKRANIMALMKDKLNQLESLNRELMCKLDVKSRYQQIKELMGEHKYFETERDIFCVGDECVVYQMRIADSKEEAYKLFRKIHVMCVERPTIDSTAYGETGENSKQIATNVEQRDC